MKNLIGCNKTNYTLPNLPALICGLRNPIAQSVTHIPVWSIYGVVAVGFPASQFGQWEPGCYPLQDKNTPKECSPGVFAVND